MPTPLPVTGAASDPDPWHELEDSFARLGQLARSGVAPDQFYRTLLDETIRALSAVGGAVWLRASSGALQPAVQLNWAITNFAEDEEHRHAHDSLLGEVAAGGEVTLIDSRTLPGKLGSASRPSAEYMLLVGPVRIETTRAGAPRLPSRETAKQNTAATVAIIEIVLRTDASPNTYRSCEQFLAAACEIAADYHAHSELWRLRRDDSDRQRLLEFAGEVHRSLNLTETAYIVANEGRNIAGCDRLSVLAAPGGRIRLLATSGVSRVERRSDAARQLEQLAELVRRADDPAWYADGQSDALPPIADALEHHAESSHARQVAIIPLSRPTDAVTDSSKASEHRERNARHDWPSFVLVAEQFDARGDGLERGRVLEMSTLAATALYNALEVDRLPLVWLIRPLSAAKQAVAAHVTGTAFVLAALAAIVTALIFVPADFTVEAPGTLQPAVRQDIFAPRSGLVDEVLVTHGQDIAAGVPLVRLRDPQLELEMKRVDGELETSQRQLDAVRATRTNRTVRDAKPIDTFRLSAEERELDQRLTNLRNERELLEREREKLVVMSPIAGRVLTWDVANRLIARPVDRGDVLVTLADLSAGWQLDLDVPDDRIGHVVAARGCLLPDLPVEFRLSSDDRELHSGRISEVCMTADVDAEAGGTPTPTVLVKVALDEKELVKAAGDELRPGVSARAQIACGRRPLGYVWLHDIWDAVVGWLRF